MSFRLVACEQASIEYWRAWLDSCTWWYSTRYVYDMGGEPWVWIGRRD